jgi:alkaline phosphatase
MKKATLFTRSLAFLVLLSLLFSLVTGCQTNVSDNFSSLPLTDDTTTLQSLEETTSQIGTTLGDITTNATTTATRKTITTTPKSTTNSSASKNKQPVNGSTITDYTIVVNSNGGWEVYAAYYLAQYIEQHTGKDVNITDDSSDPVEREILVGSTNRPESKAAAKKNLKDGQYMVYEENNRIVLYGKDIGVVYAVSDYINKHVKSWSPPIHDGFSTTPKVKDFTFTKAKNIILMIGDGMGPQQVAYARTFGKFYADSFPNKGVIKTGSKSGVTDSAAAATAISSGYKTKNTYLGMDSNKTVHKNIRELAYEKGYKTAVLTNDKATGATPSGFTVHTDSRDNLEDIKKQQQALLIEGKIDFLRGKENFTKPGYIDNLREALNVISKDGKNFFIMAEETEIDAAGHNNNLNLLKNAILRFNESIAYAAVFAICTPGTVLIVTADHETGGLTKTEKGEFQYTSTKHTGVNVLVFAIGSGTEFFNRKELENTEIAKFMGRILGVDNLGSDAA